MGLCCCMVYTPCKQSLKLYCDPHVSLSVCPRIHEICTLIVYHLKQCSCYFLFDSKNFLMTDFLFAYISILKILKLMLKLLLLKHCFRTEIDLHFTCQTGLCQVLVLGNLFIFFGGEVWLKPCRWIVTCRHLYLTMVLRNVCNIPISIKGWGGG